MVVICYEEIVSDSICDVSLFTMQLKLEDGHT